jgi:hypothetical protein
MQFVLIGSLGVLALGSLALVQTAARAPVSAPVGDYSIERPFADGGQVRLQLASGDYTVRAGASDRVVVRWHAGDVARLEDLKKLDVDVQVAGSLATIVTDGPVKHREFTVELPSRSDVHLRMRAGEVTMTGIEGHKNVRMTAGEMTIGVRAESLGSATPRSRSATSTPARSASRRAASSARSTGLAAAPMPWTPASAPAT